MIKRRKRLTCFHRKEIILLTQKGLTINKIADKLKLSVNMVRKYFTKWDVNKSRSTPIYMGSKNNPYYNNENDYGFMPSYKLEDLSPSEIDIYLKLN